MFVLYVILVFCATQLQCEKIEKLTSPNYLRGMYHKFLAEIKLNNTDHELSETCSDDILLLFDAFSKGEMWAIEMFDAASKLQSGYGTGNVINFGAYDQCLSLRKKFSDREIKGKYCVYGIIVNKIPKNFIINIPEIIQQLEGLPLMEALCVPESCSAADLTVVFNSTGLGIANLMSLDSLFSDKLCQIQDSPSATKFTPLHGLFLFIVFGNLLLMIISTTYDLYLRRTHIKPYHKSMISFSLYTNIKQLTTVKKDPDQLSCVNGIRTLCMAWVVLGHRFMVLGVYPHFNYLDTFDWIEDPTSTIVTGALFAVDTFFVISGCLVFYIIMLAKAKDFKFNLFHYHIHRIFRLIPAMFMVMLYYMTYMKNTSYGTGPFWPIVYNTIENACENYWWKSLLFIQNTVTPSDSCVVHTWYIAVDSQLYFLAPILLIPLQRWPKHTLVGIVFLFLSSLIYGFVTAWNLEVPASYLAVGTSFTQIYANTPVRSNAWFIGALLGYFLFTTRGKKVQINKYVAALLWISSIGFMSWMVYLQSYFNSSEYDRFTNTLYLTLSKPVWSLGQAWIIFACVRGYSGFIGPFLSNRIFIVIGRISYSMYLLHLTVIYYSLCKTKTMEYFSNYNAFYIYWGDLLYTLVLSFIWSITFESPMIALGKAFMNPDMQKRLEEIAEENETAYEQQQQINKQYVTKL